MATKSDKKTTLGILILAAGEGTRMESALPKVLHPVCGLPMVLHVLRAAHALKPESIGLVVGFKADEVKAAVVERTKALGMARPVQFLQQKTQKGSGHAVQEASSFLKKVGRVLILCGDAPLISFETLFAMLRLHEEQKAQVTVLTGRLANPKGYGRILRTPAGEVQRIVEEGEASAKEAAVNEVNSGVYVADAPALLKAVARLEPRGPKGELQLTDAVELVRQDGGRVLPFLTHAAEEVLGVNSRPQLAQAERVMNRRLVERLLVSGVSVADPSTLWLDATVEVGPECVIEPSVLLRGATQIGRGSRIGPFTSIVDSQIGPECRVTASFVDTSRILEKSSVGPFANVRPDTVAGPRARIGNFTEVKASRIGFGSKVPHLAYIGDAEIAEDVNVGAGTITCNYDGEKKHKTVIGAKAFIGSNVNLVAPVKIGRGARVGAGSTITEDVPESSLAIARALQVNKPPKDRNGRR